MTWRKRKNIFYQRQRLGSTAEQKITGERVRRELARNAARGEHGAKLGSKCETVIGLGVVERLDAQRIAGQENERPGGEMFAQIKQGEGKHAAQFVKQVFAPLLPAVNKNLGIGFGLEAVSGENQTLTQFGIV